MIVLYSVKKVRYLYIKASETRNWWLSPDLRAVGASTQLMCSEMQVVTFALIATMECTEFKPRQFGYVHIMDACRIRAQKP